MSKCSNWKKNFKAKDVVCNICLHYNKCKVDVKNPGVIRMNFDLKKQKDRKRFFAHCLKLLRMQKDEVTVIENIDEELGRIGNECLDQLPFMYKNPGEVV